MTKEQSDREQAINGYLNHESITAIARKLGRSRTWVYKWIERYESLYAASNWPEDRTKRPHNNPREVPGPIVEAVKLARLQLYNEGVFCGAQAISWELERMEVTPLPSLSTISRIVRREGLTHRRTGRYEAKGKRYPKLASEQPNEVHQSDFVGPCYLRGPVRFYSLNSVDIATARCAITPVLDKTAQSTIDAFWANWCRLGIPRHQQIDNEMVFYGSLRYPRAMGSLIRLCLTQGVEPWFIPMREPWRNGVVEKFNDLYRKGLLQREELVDVESLHRGSMGFEQKHNSRYRYTKLHSRTPLMALGEQAHKLRFPATREAPRHPLPKPETGRYNLVRFVRGDAILDIFGEKFRAPSSAVYEYVTATVDVDKQKLRITMNDVTIDEHDYPLR